MMKSLGKKFWGWVTRRLVPTKLHVQAEQAEQELKVARETLAKEVVERKNVVDWLVEAYRIDLENNHYGDRIREALRGTKS